MRTFGDFYNRKNRTFTIEGRVFHSRTDAVHYLQRVMDMTTVEALCYCNVLMGAAEKEAASAAVRESKIFHLYEEGFLSDDGAEVV